MDRLCRSLPLLIVAALGGCCWTPIAPGPVPDAGPFFRPDGGATRDAPIGFRDVAPPDAPPPLSACAVEIPSGAACDDEPCVGPVRRIRCPGGLQHLSVARAAGRTFLSASYPPRLLELEGDLVIESPLGLEGDGQATLVTDATDALRVVYADSSLATAALGADRDLLAADRAYWVVLGAAVDPTNTLHMLYLDDAPALHASTTSLEDPTSRETFDVSPSHFADSAFALGPEGVPHYAFWRHRTPTSAGRDLLVVDGDGAPHTIATIADPNDDGTNVSIAATATALVASLDFADGLHTLSPDDTVEGTSYRDVLVPGTTPFAVSGCPELPTPGPFGSCPVTTCEESGAGFVRRAHEMVRFPDGSFGLVWLERAVARSVQLDEVCGEPGCACIRTTLAETAETTLVVARLDPVTGTPERLLSLALGDVDGSSLAVATSAGHLLVATHGADLTATLADVDLALLGP